MIYSLFCNYEPVLLEKLRRFCWGNFFKFFIYWEM